MMAAGRCDICRIGCRCRRSAGRGEVQAVNTETSFRGARSANPESRDSPMCNCTSEVWSFGPSRNDSGERFGDVIGEPLELNPTQESVMGILSKISTGLDERSARLAGIGLMLLSIFMFSFGDALGN